MSLSKALTAAAGNAEIIDPTVYNDNYVATYNKNFSSGSSFSSYTTPSIYIGSQYITTKIFCVNYITVSGGVGISSASIGGTPCTIYQQTGGSGWQQSAILVATKPSVSDSLSLTFGGSLNTYGNSYFAVISISVYETDRTTSFDYSSILASGSSRDFDLTTNTPNSNNSFVIANAVMADYSGSTINNSGNILTTDYQSLTNYHPSYTSNILSASATTSSAVNILLGTWNYSSLGALRIK